MAVQGSRERGIILHKLMEEVLSGETGDDVSTAGDGGKLVSVGGYGAGRLR